MCGTNRVTTLHWCVTFSGQVLSSVHGLTAQVAHHVVHCGLMLKKDGANNFVVEELGAIPRQRSHAPEQEETLVEQMKI